MYAMPPNWQHGWVEVIVGCMFSGKTEELMRRLRRAQFAKLSVKAFKPKIDVRYSEERIVSHSEASHAALPVQQASSIYEMCGDAQVVGIDEAQFFDDKLPEVVDKLARDGKRVIVAGLDMDYRGVPFGVVPVLMARADAVLKVHAICLICGAPATRSQRIVDAEEQVLVGADAAYQARCRKHWSPQPVFAHQERISAQDG